MDEEPDKSVLISVLIEFETPAEDPVSYHRRTLSGVPKSKAEKMSSDFEAYGGSEADVSPHKVYRYEDEEGEMLLVELHFTEITDVHVQAPANGRTSVNGSPFANRRACADG